jgi:hypothetical protein
MILKIPFPPDLPGLSPSPAGLTQRPERASHLHGEELRLLPRGEVATPFGLVEVGEGRVRLLDGSVASGQYAAG